MSVTTFTLPNLMLVSKSAQFTCPIHELSVCLTDLTTEEENYNFECNVLKETGYLGDVEASSGESSEAQSSDSEDDIPTVSWKGNLLS